MRIGIVTTGDEIITGITADKNFNWASGVLAENGFDVSLQISVGDNIQEIIEAFGFCMKKCDAVIISGGLGPTPDDLTSEAASTFFGTKLQINELALKMVENSFTHRDREMKEIHNKQALLPVGSEVMENKCGTAPGFYFDNEGTIFFFLPGVPKEYKGMLLDSVLPHLKKRFEGSKIFGTRVVKTFGLKESEVTEKLESINSEDINIGYHATYPEVHIRLSTYTGTKRLLDKKLTEAVGRVREFVGDYVFSTSDETMEEVVGKLLRDRNQTISTAESCTGGLLSNRITNVPGSSDYFLRGYVTYSNEAKIEDLGVDKKLIDKFGAVSTEVVEQMAKGARERSGSSIGIGISGIAGPGGGTVEKPVGTVYIGLSHDSGKIFSQRFNFYGNREEIKIITSESTLDIIMRFLNINV